MPSRCTNFSDRDRDGRNKNMFDYFDEDDKCHSSLLKTSAGIGQTNKKTGTKISFFKTCEIGPSEVEASGSMQGSHQLNRGTNPNTVYYVNPRTNPNIALYVKKIHIVWTKLIHKQ